MKSLHMVAFILLVLGGLNVGLSAVNFDVLDMLLGQTIGQIVYVLIGLSALFVLVTHKNDCKECCAPNTGSAM